MVNIFAWVDPFWIFCFIWFFLFLLLFMFKCSPPPTLHWLQRLKANGMSNWSRTEQSVAVMGQQWHLLWCPLTRHSGLCAQLPFGIQCFFTSCALYQHFSISSCHIEAKVTCTQGPKTIEVKTQKFNISVICCRKLKLCYLILLIFSIYLSSKSWRSLAFIGCSSSAAMSEFWKQLLCRCVYL